MSTPIDNEKYPPSGDGAKLPGLASPSNDVNQLRNVVDNLKEIVEIREGRRGSKYDQTVTWRDLYNVGLIAVQSGGNTFIQKTSSGGVSGVTLLSPNLQVMMVDDLNKKIKTSAAYNDLKSDIGAAASYKGAPQEVIDVLTTNLSDEAVKRGADIRKVETKIQQVDKSLALSVQELTAGINGAQASVREVMYSSATRDKATAGKLVTINARLNDFGGQGVTVEQKMTATVSRVNGLEGLYSVKIKIDNNGTPYIAGYALSSSLTAGGEATSSFVINATNFQIYRPGSTSFSPFGVDSVTNTVYINGTLKINSGGDSISTVSTTATNANTTANAANTTANAASTAASTANTTANAANSAASTANATATAANSAAAIANATATTANTTANTANATANSAYNLASSATSAVSSKLNKSGADVLTGPISLQASNTIFVGTISDGIAIGSSGIIGRKSGVTTFAVNADGSATFSGDIDTTGRLNLYGSGNVFVPGTADQTKAYIDGSQAFYAIYAKGAGTFKTAIFGEGNNGNGVVGTSTGVSSAVYGLSYGIGNAVLGIAQGGGAGVSCQGPFRWGYYTYSAPDGGTDKYLRNDGNWALVASLGGGTVTNVSGTGSVSGLTLSGSVSTSGYLTLGGSLSISYSQVINALGYTPPSSAVSSFNGRSGAVSLSTSDLTGTSPSASYFLSGVGWIPVTVVNTLNGSSGAVTNAFYATVSYPSVGFSVSGSGTNSVTYNVYQTSDRSLKKDIVDSDRGLNFLMTLKPRSYFWNSEHMTFNKRTYGLIADEVLSSCAGEETSLAYTNSGGVMDGKMAVDYSSFVSVLVKAVQELNQKVIALESKYA